MVDTDPSHIDEVLNRSIAQILPSKEEFRKALLEGRPLRIYIGADATGPQLHLGHATNFMLMEKLRRMGHEIIILFGDFTAMIGDPTDKDAARVRLTQAQVDAHIESWKEQVGKIVSFDDAENPAKIMKNSEWLSKLSFGDVVELASNFTVQQMLERDMFARRLKEEKPVYIHEFMYPLMQGYDSVAMNVDVEVGGTDQTFNMLAGRTLQRKFNNKDKFVIATTLLENPKTGKKLMSKSEGGYIALNDTPTDMFGKTMALPDEAITQVFIDCTYLPLKEIREIEAALTAGGNPRDAKLRLGRELVTIYHGAEAAQAAESDFVETFSKGGIPEDVETVKVSQGMLLVDVLLERGVVASKTEFRRLLEDGAIHNAETGERITDSNAEVEPLTYKVGKRRFLKAELS